LAKEIRFGAPGTELLEELPLLEELCGRSVLLWRSAKMHPSSTSCDSREPGPPGLFAATIVLTRPADDLPVSHARN
jgi:hypothetical protein